MVRIDRPTRRHHRGFSLVEIMVAMVIGMFGIIVMMQVFALSEERKRTTTSGGDATIEGVMALYGVQRDLRMAGYGISDTRLLGCNVLLRTGVTLASMAPVTINHASITGQDANTDTLLVVYGNSNGTPQGDNVTMASGGVATPTAFIVGDRVITTYLTRPSPCSLVLAQVAAVDAVAKLVTLNPVAAVPSPQPVGYPIGNALFNMGQAPRIVGYAIRSGNLTTCDFTDAAKDCINNAGDWISIANNIVSLRAQYGRDTLTATSAGTAFKVNLYDQTTPTTICGFARIPAVRLALVARSAQSEKTAVTAAAPLWDGTFLADGTTADRPIVLTGLANWTNYRYKLFQTVVPIRNVTWMGVISGC